MSKPILIVESEGGKYPSLKALVAGCNVFSRATICNTFEQAQESVRKGTFSALILTAESSSPELLAFLRLVDERQPGCLQFFRSEAQTCLDINDGQEKLRRWLSPQLESGALESALKIAFLREELNQNQGLQALLGKMEDLPSVPTLYLEVTSKLQSPDAALDDVAVHIAHDPAMSALLLRLANSAGSGLTQPVKTVLEAILFLGTEQTKALILFSKLFSQYQQRPCPGFSLDDFWLHSIWTATFAKWIAQEETSDYKKAEEAFAAGMLHDVGKLLIAANLPRAAQEISQAAKRSPKLRWQVEQEQLGATHAEIGALLLAEWGLPYEILEAIAFHHKPGAAEGTSRLTPLTTVHVANLFTHVKEQRPDAGTIEPVDLAYLRSIYAKPPLERWQSLCGLDEKT